MNIQWRIPVSPRFYNIFLSSFEYLSFAFVSIFLNNASDTVITNKFHIHLGGRIFIGKRIYDATERMQNDTMSFISTILYVILIN